MKVLFFDFTTMVGGATKGSVYLLQRLKNQGIETSIIDVYGSCTEYMEDIKKSEISLSILYPKNEGLVIGHLNDKIRRILSIIRQIPSFIKILVNLYKEIRRQNPDYVLVNNDKSLFFLSLIKRILSFKIIMYYRGEASQLQMSNRFINLVNKYSDVRYCHSINAINNMKKYGVIGTINYLPNCISVAEIKELIVTKNSEVKVLLSAGRIVEEKGYHTAIEAIGILKASGYYIKLLLPGLVVDQNYLLRINELISRFKLNEQVIFLGWVDNITEVLASVDYMVLPSYTEGFPRSIIESMLLKIPVCATPVGGIPEAILHAQTGYLFNVNDADGLANVIKTMIDNPIDKKNLIENAYKFALENFDENINTQIFLNNLK